MDYNTFKHLTDSFLQGEFDYPEVFTMENNRFTFSDSSSYPLIEMVREKVRGMTVYTSEDNKQNLIFISKPTKGGSISPADVKLISEAEGSGPNISGLKSDIMTKVKQQLDKQTDKATKDRDKMFKDIEKMVTGHQKEMEKMSQEHESKMGELEQAFADLIDAHNDASDRLSGEHSDRMGDIESALDELKNQHEERVDQMIRDHEGHKEGMRQDHDNHVKKMTDAHGDKLRKMKRDFADRLADLRTSSEDKSRKMQRYHQDTVRKTMDSHEENQEQARVRHQTEMDKMRSKHDESKIGLEAHVQIMNLHNSPALVGKVDTGATICSLHVDDMNIDQQRNTVRFKNKELSDHVISVPIASMSSVRSADGGMTYRPVIRLNLVIKGKDLSGIEVNLNDRGNMDHPFLIGHNALEKGKFLVDTSSGMGEGVSTGINFDFLQILVD